ncbi:MAG TPA: hypothetical protein VG164_15145 [Trebonia sp.]|nr:hypothetical protein [Trebonia sp.]
MGITYASNALSQSIPFAGTELAVVYSYRQFRRRGLDAPTTSWGLTVSWICSAGALAGAAVYLVPVAGILLAPRFTRVRGVLHAALAWVAGLSKRTFGKPEHGADGLDTFLDEVSRTTLALPEYAWAGRAHRRRDARLEGGRRRARRPRGQLLAGAARGLDRDGVPDPPGAAPAGPHITRSTALTVYNTVGFADMPAADMRDANTLFATSSQLAAGLAVAVATVALRVGGLFPGAAGGTTAYTFAFCLLGGISLVTAIEATRLRPGAGDAVRSGRAPRPAATAGERA